MAIFGEIISTGSEMMLGRLVDTNSAWLSEVLTSAGIRVARHTSVGDELPGIVKAFQRAWDEHNIVAVTGGLGPTEDDLTRQAAALAFGRELEYHENLAEDLRRRFAASGYTLTENNLRQAWLPRGSLLIPNHSGTAPGFALAGGDRLMVFLPGVPAEMKRMVREWFLPQLKERFPAEQGLTKTVVMKTAGLGESAVDSLIGDLVSPDRNPAVGLLAGPDMVRVIVAARGADEGEAEAALAPVLAELEKRLAGHVFAYGETTLPRAAAELVKKMGLSLHILDAATQGRLSGALSPVLEPDNWGGARDLPWPAGPGGVGELVENFWPVSAVGREGEIRLAVVCRPDTEAPAPAEGQTSLIVESMVQSAKLNNGRPIVDRVRVGGARSRALSRAASLSVFHLWRALRQGLRELRPDCATMPCDEKLETQL